MIFFFPLYFLFFLFEITKSSNLFIPFKVQNLNISQNEKMLVNYIYKDIFVNLLIGNPPQKIKLSPCLGEYTTFVLSYDTEGFEGGTYNKNLSNSYKSLIEGDEPEYYIFQTFSLGIKSLEKFIIGEKETYEIEINNLEFILASEVNDNCYNPYCEYLTQPGILGFQIYQLPNQFQENVSSSNFISQLKKKDLIPDYYFSFHFDSENSGNIIIGLKPDEYNSSNYKLKEYCFVKTSISSKEYLDWSIKFDNIYYGNTELSNEYSILLRIEFGLITGYYEWEKILKAEFFDKLIEEKKCFKDYTHFLGSTAYFYYCNKSTNISNFKPFSFSINEYQYNFTLDYKDLFIEVEDKYLFLMIFGGIYDLILGYPFLKKYEIIFNQDIRTIGFYKDKSNKDNSDNSSSSSNTYYYIIIISLSIILCLLIYFGINLYVKRRKTEKKYAVELYREKKEDNDNKNDLLYDGALNN